MSATAKTVFHVFNFVVCLTVIVLLFIYVVSPETFTKLVLAQFPEYKNGAISNIRFKDDKLNTLILKAHTDLVETILYAQSKSCADVASIYKMIDDYATQLDANKDQLNIVCKTGSSDVMKAMVAGYMNMLGVNDPQINKLSNSLVELYAYAIPKMFCNGDTFDIKALTEYLKSLVKELCDPKSDFMGISSSGANYMLRKPLSLSGKF